MLRHYLATAWRHFARHKLTTAISLFGLVLGLSCFVLGCAAVAYVRASDGHHPHAERLVYLTQTMHLLGTSTTTPPMIDMPYVVADLLREDFPEIERIARVRTEQLAVSNDGATMSVYAAFADAELTRIFQFGFIRGGADALTAPRSVVITEDLASRMFGTADPMGRTLLFKGSEAVQVRGVIASPRQPSIFGETASAGIRAEAFVSMDTHRALVGETAAASVFSGWRESEYAVFALLRPGESGMAWQTRLEKFAATRVPTNTVGRDFALRPIADRLQQHLQQEWKLEGSGIRADVMVLALAGLILLISCLNTANLAAAVAMTRAREIGVRRIIGGRRSQIIAQQLIEAVMMVMVAFAAVMAILFIACVLFRQQWGIDLWTTLWSGRWPALTVPGMLGVVIVVCAGYPSFLLTRARPVEALQRQRSRAALPWAPNLLVTLQFIIASLLITTVLLIQRQNARLHEWAGVGADGQVVIVNSNLREAGVKTEMLLERLRLQPHIAAVSARHMSPWEGYSATSLATSADPAAKRLPVFTNVVAYDYLRTMNIPLLAGRDFTRDRSDDEMPVAAEPTRLRHAIVDRSTAISLGWSNPAEVVGKRIWFPSGRDGGAATPIDVIGVVEDRLHVLQTFGPTSTLYTLTPARAVIPIIRIGPGDPRAALAEIEQVWRELAPGKTLSRQFADERFEAAFRSFNVFTLSLRSLAMLAILIAIGGMIGMAIHSLERRTHEIGVRKTLGASSQRIAVMLLRDFSMPVIAAGIIAWPLATVAARTYINGFARVAEPAVTPYLAGLTLTLIIACAAVLIQSLRTARVAPVDVLRQE